MTVSASVSSSVSVSVPTLRAVSPSAFSGASADLKSAAARLRRDCVTFQAKVQHPLQAGHAWHGGGQPDAEVVVRINALAYGTASMRMQSAGNVLGALGHALTKAKRRLTDVERQVREAHLVIDKDDKVTAEQGWGFDRHSPSPSWSKTGDIDPLQRKLDGVLLFATAADTLARTQLSRYTKPLITTQTADRSLLKRALTDNAEAASDLLGSRALAEQLTRAEPRTLPPDQTLDKLLEYAHAYAPVAQDAIIIFLGAVLEAEGLIGMGAGILGGVALSETGVGLVAGAGVVAAEGAIAYGGYRLATWGTERLDKDLALARAKTRGESGTRHQPQPGEVVCKDGKTRVYEPSPKHGRQQRGKAGPAPTNGPETLKNSIQAPGNTTRRIGVDPKTGEYVVFDEHQPGRFHAHTRPWNGDPSAGAPGMEDRWKRIFHQAGVVDYRTGKILGR